MSVCDQVCDAIVCPLPISFLAQSSLSAKVRELMKETEVRKGVLGVQISNINDMVIDTIIILTLSISFARRLQGTKAEIGTDGGSTYIKEESPFTTFQTSNDVSLENIGSIYHQSLPSVYLLAT